MASKHEQNRAEKRERLLSAAVDAFTEAGFDNTTVSDVVHRAGMTPSTFYNYYRDKDALRDELLAHAAGRMQEALSAIRGKAGSAEEYFRMAARGLFEAMVVDQTTAMLLRRNLPLLRSLLDDKALKSVYATLRTDVETAAGRAPSDGTDADYASAVLRSASVEIAIVLLSKPTPNVEEAVDFLTRVLSAAFKL